MKQSTWSKAFNSNAIWEEKVRPNNQNERMLGLSYPEFEDENKLQGGNKVTCWGPL